MVFGSVAAIALGIVGTQKIFEERKLLTELHATVNTLNMKAALLKNTDENQLDGQIKTAISSLPLLAPYQETLSLLFSLFIRHNVGVSELKFSSVLSKGKTLMNVELSLVGEYQSIRSFLESLDHSVPLISVNSLKFVRKVSSATEGLYGANISLLVNQDPAPKTIGKASDPLPKISPDLEKVLSTLRGFTSFQIQTSGQSSEMTPATTLFSP